MVRLLSVAASFTPTFVASAKLPLTILSSMRMRKWNVRSELPKAHTTKAMTTMTSRFCHDMRENTPTSPDNCSNGSNCRHTHTTPAYPTMIKGKPHNQLPR